MGNTFAFVQNNTPYPICVLTFNNADISYGIYKEFYVIPAGFIQRVEAIANPVGLKFAVIYKVSQFGHFYYKRWALQKEKKVFVESITCDNVLTSGSHHSLDGFGDGFGNVSYSYWSDFETVLTVMAEAHQQVPRLLEADLPSAHIRQRTRRPQSLPDSPTPTHNQTNLTEIIRAQRTNLHHLSRGSGRHSSGESFSSQGSRNKENGKSAHDLPRRHSTSASVSPAPHDHSDSSRSSIGSRKLHACPEDPLNVPRSSSQSSSSKSNPPTRRASLSMLADMYPPPPCPPPTMLR